jgi:hypothetical protein
LRGSQLVKYSDVRNIISEAGEVIAKTTDDGTLIGGQHRLLEAASAGQDLFWQDTREAVNLDPAFFKQLGGFYRHSA